MIQEMLFTKFDLIFDRAHAVLRIMWHCLLFALRSKFEFYQNRAQFNFMINLFTRQCDIISARGTYLNKLRTELFSIRFFLFQIVFCSMWLMGIIHFAFHDISLFRCLLHPLPRAREFSSGVVKHIFFCGWVGGNPGRMSVLKEFIVWGSHFLDHGDSELSRWISATMITAALTISIFTKIDVIITWRYWSARLSLLLTLMSVANWYQFATKINVAVVIAAIIDWLKVSS